MLKFSRKSDRFSIGLSKDMSQIVPQIPDLAMLKNPSKLPEFGFFLAHRYVFGKILTKTRSVVSRKIANRQTDRQTNRQTNVG